MRQKDGDKHRWQASVGLTKRSNRSSQRHCRLGSETRKMSHRPSVARVPGSGERVESGPFPWEAAAVVGAESGPACAGTRRRPKRKRMRRRRRVVLFDVVLVDRVDRVALGLELPSLHHHHHHYHYHHYHHYHRYRLSSTLSPLPTRSSCHWGRSTSGFVACPKKRRGILATAASMHQYPYNPFRSSPYQHTIVPIKHTAVPGR